MKKNYLFMCYLFLICSPVFGKDIMDTLKSHISEDEYNLFVPMIYDENIFTVIKSSNGMFCIKGLTFHQNLNFPVSLGHQFFVSDEEKEIFPNEAYRVHLTLTSVHSGKSERFVSNIISTKEFETVVEAIEINRKFDIDKGGDDDPYQLPYVEIEYLLTLEDNTQYHHFLKVGGRMNDNTIRFLTDIEKTFYIQSGDKFTNFRLDETYPWRYDIKADFYHEVNGKLEKLIDPIEEMKKYKMWSVFDYNYMVGEEGGETRNLQEDHHALTFTVVNSTKHDPYYFTVEDFGDLRGGVQHRGIGWQTDSTPYIKKEMQILGFYWKYKDWSHSYDQIFVFFDESGHLLFYKPPPLF